MVGNAYHAQMQLAGAFTARASSASAIRSSGRSRRNIQAFAVDGRPDLGMIVYNPVIRSDADRIRSFVTSLPMQPSIAAVCEPRFANNPRAKVSRDWFSTLIHFDPML